MPDNGALLTPGSTEGGCPTCEETSSVQCGIEPAEQTCSTPVCNSNYGSLPKKKAGRIITRSGECLYDNPTVPTVAPQVWQRGLDGIDRIAPLTSAMIPGKSDAPCFTTVEEAAEDTFGNAVIAQVDDDTGKTCLKQVPLEDTSDAYLAGYTAEDVCSGVPKVRPVRIIPTGIEGCPDNIQMLGITQTEEEVQPGLIRLRPRIVKLNSPSGKTSQVPSYTAIDDAGTGCLQPAVWHNDGECVTMARLKTEEGVMGAWASAAGCLKFYELPKDGDGNYLTDYTLSYVGGDASWEWQLNGYKNGSQVLIEKWTSAGVSYDSGKVIVEPTDLPRGAKFAILHANLNSTIPSSPAASAIIKAIGYWGEDQSLEIPFGTTFALAGGPGLGNFVADVPILNGTVAVKLTITVAGPTPLCEAGISVIGFR